MKKCIYFSFFVLVKNFQAHKAALFKDPPPLQESQDYSSVFCLKEEVSMFLTKRGKAWKCHFQQVKTWKAQLLFRPTYLSIFLEGIGPITYDFWRWKSSMRKKQKSFL